MKDEYTKICYQIAKQDQKKQDAIMEALKKELGEEAFRCVLVGVSYFRLLIYPELKESMMLAVSEQLYAEFNKER